MSEGGVVVETEGWNFYSDVLLLMRKLRLEEIDGFILDKYTYMYTQVGKFYDFFFSNSLFINLKLRFDFDIVFLLLIRTSRNIFHFHTGDYFWTVERRD